MQRLHLSKHPLLSARDAAQFATPTRKPCGLWWGCGRDFVDLVRFTRLPRLRRFRSRIELSEILLRPSARLLSLGTPDELRAFTAEFGRPICSSARPDSPRDRMVDWAAVAGRFDGIEVTDLCRDQRPRLEWLDIDWDAPSGCVWRADAVMAIQRTTP